MTLNIANNGNSKLTDTSPQYRFYDLVQKPIEIYVFIDPLCLDCWSLEPYLKKLSFEYGRFFTIRPIISNHLQLVSGKQDRYHTVDEYHTAEHPVLFPSISLAVKAAELQGKNAGRTFLRKVQENYFLKKQNVFDITVLIHCAEESKLDVQEFENDLSSISAKNAIQSDLNLTNEMDVMDTPTIVFFNEQIEEQGIKISGLNSYETYVLILKKMLQKDPIPSQKPPLEDFLTFHGVAAHREISIVYDWTAVETERAMKKLQLKQRVKKALATNEVFWKYSRSI